MAGEQLTALSNPYFCVSSQDTDHTKGFLAVSFSRMKKALEKALELGVFRGNASFRFTNHRMF